MAAGIGQRLMQGSWTRDVLAPADKLPPVRFILDSAYTLPLYRHQVQNKEAGIFFAAGPAEGQQAIMLVHRFGLDKQVVERRMSQIRILARQGRLKKAGYLQASFLGAVVSQGDPADFCIVFSGNDDFRLGVKIRCLPEKAGPILKKADPVKIRLNMKRRQGCRPYLIGI